MWTRAVFVRLTLLVCLNAVPAFAQVPPTANEAQAYQGLHRAAWEGNLSHLKALIVSGQNLEAKDAYGRTALHIATYARQREIIRHLAKTGAQLGALEQDRYDAVTIASVADDSETLALLLQLGASAKLITSRYDGTALIAAAHLGHDDIVRQLLAAGAPVDHVNNLHWTAVIESIVLGDGSPRYQRTLDALIKAGANLNLTDGSGRTPMQLVRSRNFKAMETLLQNAGAQ